MNKIEVKKEVLKELMKLMSDVMKKDLNSFAENKKKKPELVSVEVESVEGALPVELEEASEDKPEEVEVLVDDECEEDEEKKKKKDLLRSLMKQ